MRVDELSPDILGVLVCVVIRARNLPDKTVIGKQSPYATVTFGNHKKRTKTIPRGGQQPTWDEEFRFEIPKDINAVGPGSSLSTNKHGGVGSVSGVGAAESVVGKGKGKGKFEIRESAVVLPQHKGKRLLRLAVYADDAKDPHLIGDALLELEETIKKGSFDDWVPLELKNRSAGEIYLELTWYHNGPRPKSRAPRQPDSSAASSYGGAGLRIADPEPALASQQPGVVDDWDRDGASSVGGGYPQRPLSQGTFHQPYAGPPLELGADYPDPDVAPLANSLAALSVRPALPLPPAHQQLAHSTSYYDSPVSPTSATSYSRPLPDPRVMGGSINGGGYDHAQQQQWRHSSPYPAQQAQAQASVNGYPAGPSNGYGQGQGHVGEFGATAYAPAPHQQGGADDHGQWQASHHASYSDVGHQADYGAPPPPIGEFEHLANQHRYSTGTPLPPPGAYGAPPVAAYHQPPPLPQPPQPPIPPPTPLEYERQVYGGGASGMPPHVPSHLLGRSQSVATVGSGYSAYNGPVAPGSAVPPQQFAPAQYAPPLAQSPYNAPPPSQSPYSTISPQHAYSPAPPPQPSTYNPYAAGPGHSPAPPVSAPSPANYNAGYGSVNGYPASDYGPPPGAPAHSNGGYREPSPVPPQPPQGQGQGNYLRQQYDLNVAQQQQHGLGQSQGPCGGPPPPPPRPESGYGAQGAYNPYAYQ